MRTMIVDDENLAIDALEYILDDFEEVEIIGTFQNAREALAFAEEEQPDIAFLDIQIPGIGGIDLAARIKEKVSGIKIVFATGYNNYANQAFEVEAFGYILKPFTNESVKKVIQRAEKMRLEQPKEPIKIHTFGRFDIFMGSEPIVFKNKKAKELIALCVDHHGGQVTMEEVIDKLWEERAYDERTKKLYRKAVMIASHTMIEAGVKDFFKTSRGLCYIDHESVECDYYQLLKGNPKVIPYYHGEYLFEYDWAEDRIPKIEKIIEELKKT